MFAKETEQQHFSASGVHVDHETRRAARTVLPQWARGLGEMLLEMKEPAQALKQFEATLTKEPRRFRALYGAARAAQLSGNNEASRRYFGELLKVCGRADNPGRSEIVEAQRVTSQN
jgi:Tfp pilus assembly protein PilF